jgi:hypothetical protein
MKQLLLSLFILVGIGATAQDYVLTPTGNKLASTLVAGDVVVGEHGNNTIEGNMIVDTEFVHNNLNEEFYFFVINGKYFYKNQSVFVKENGAERVIHAFMLVVGDTLLTQSSYTVITSIAVDSSLTTWNRLSISGDHSYFLNGVLVHNASRFWVGGGSSANWNAITNTNWSATSGGSNNASVPASTDDVTFNGAGTNGNTSSTISAVISVLSLNITSGYTATMTHSAVLTIAGNVTFGANYTIAGSSGIIISAASTITSNGKTWPNAVTFSGVGTTKTLVGNWVLLGAVSILANTQVINATTNETLSCAGIGMTNTTTVGTAKIILTGGSWSGSGVLANDMDMQGNITVTGTVTYGQGKTLRYVSGTNTNTSANLTLIGGATLDIGGTTWTNITFNGTGTYTLNSAITTSLLNIGNGVGVTFAGSFGLTANTWNCNQSSAGSTITLVNGVTYLITSSFSCNAARPATVIFTSDHATNKAILTLQQGATCNVSAAFTRIDASNGRTINTWNGTVTNCTNIQSYTDLKTVSKSFIQ